MTPKKKIKYISQWIKEYATNNNISSLVVGVSGGIDSAVVSTLCAKTNIKTIAVSMPIRQDKKLHSLSLAHCKWLKANFTNVKIDTINLTPIFDEFEKKLKSYKNELAFANSRARLRMTCLYQIAQANKGIVVGTGNKVEDFGVGFFTKYGDGGVDLSPIGDCFKSEVWEMGEELGIMKEIIEANPTDGLWNDGRTDEDQLGMSYARLEIAMQLDENNEDPVTFQEREDLQKYRAIRAQNKHKIDPIPVCKLPQNSKE